MKVKIICEWHTIEQFEKDINDFIKDKRVHTIKYTESDGRSTAYIEYEDKETD